jgi:subtilisin family serine protease
MDVIAFRRTPFHLIQGVFRLASSSSVKPGSSHRAVIAGTKILAVILAALLSVAAHAAAAPLASDPSPTVRIANLGVSLELRETAAPAKLPVHPGVRYFTTPDGALVAMANRLLVVVKDRRTLDTLLALPQVLDHAPLAQLENSHIELLETADVVTALALLVRLAQMPGVISVQPDLSQNITRHDGGRYLDWEHFDLAAAIGLRDAWRLTRGQGVRVAIIDTGIDLHHKDLRGIQRVASFDVGRRSQRIAPENAQETHGTLVAGLIFARHNGFGIDGIAPQAGLIAIRLMSGWTSATLLAFQEAAQAGADVINCSWTFPLMLDPVAHVVDELARRGRQGRGVLLVVSAGNRPIEIARPEQFPAYPGLLAVTALDHRGAPYGTAYGAGVFIAAPGLLKTTGTHHDGFEPLGATSAAAPVVSGVIALMLAANPQLSRVQVQKLLADTADRSPPGDFVDGRSTLIGVGRIHAGRAVAAAAAMTQKDKP